MVNTNQKHTYIPEIGYLRLSQVLQFIPIGKSTWWAGVASGRFPQPIKIGPRTTAWKAQDIQRLIIELEEQR